jgi:hypothetical protein
MIQKIKRQLLVMSAALMMFLPTAAVATVGVAAAADQACTSNIASGVAKGVTDTTGNGVSCDATGVDDSSITALAKRVVNTFSIVVGAASVIMIIYGGFRYIISGGESGRVGAAKTSLIYAVIGLVIVALAQLIIHFVLSQTNQLGT